MNTGVQRSGATPPAARTANTKPVGDRARERLRPGQERAADRDGARDPVRRDGDGGRAARPRVQGRARDGVPRRALHPRLRPVPARLGHGVARHDPDRPAREGDGALPRLRGRARRGRRRLEDPPPGPGRGVPAAAAPLRAPLRRPAAHRRDRADPGASPTATSAASACSRKETRRDREALRDHARRRLQPRQQDRQLAHRAARLRRPPAAVQPAPARPARTSSSGSTRPRRAAAATSAPGGRSWRTTRSRRSWAGSATTRARPPATAGQLDEAVGINSVERFLGDEAIAQGWRVEVDRAAHRQARARGRRRALRALRRLPPRPARPRASRSATPGPPPAG